MFDMALAMELAEAEVLEVLATADRGVSNTRVACSEALVSDVDGDDADSEDWYIETSGVDAGELETEEPLLAGRGGPDGPDEIDDLSDESDGGLDGEALMFREKRRQLRELQRKRLKAAIDMLPRDWTATSTNWDTLTRDEMEALALDEKALTKIRADGWDFGKFFSIAGCIYNMDKLTHVVLCF